MPSLVNLSSARQFFARNGALSQAHPNYEYRPGQLEMAETVEGALAERKHLIVEAGTGTGKTLAYLVPAILSGRRIVVSTGTKNLQEQLFFKDIPFLQRLFSRPLQVCYMKGRNNYACRQKILDAALEPVLAGIEEVAEFRVIQEWEKTTETGDRAEIRELPEASSTWAKIDARRELCSGQKCPQFERCFLTLMHRRGAESDIIIVNHHLFFADLAMRDAEYSAILPRYAAVIFDEAHEIEEVASQYFGVSLSNYQLQELVRDVAATSRRKGFGSPELDRALTSLTAAADHFFALFGHEEGREGFQHHAEFLEKNGEAYQDLLISLELLGAQLELSKGALDEVIPLARRCRELREAAQFWMESGRRDFVYWIERRGRGRFLLANPIDVAPILAQRLFEPVDTVILTSATLAVGGTLDYVKSRLGLRTNVRTVIVPGHFDYRRQALFYVPRHLPDPRDPAFAPQAAQEIARILEASRGRAFVLFTSYQQMRQVYELVNWEIDYPTLLQGTAPRSALLEEFRSTPNSVLFATSSFWQGVDVPGEQLSCVIIDKLPFAVPSDPVVEARIRLTRENGGNPFYDYQIPQAALALKQGFGRLIRSTADRGVLVLLDTRILRQRYGKVFLESLPDYAFTTERKDLEKFFDV